MNIISPAINNNDLAKFNLATEDEVKKVILAAKSTSCELDSLPTPLLKATIDASLPSITQLINLSLSSGTVPDCLKHAIIRPLLKKPHLDNEILKNYRPVSNLPFLSKVLEKLVAKRMLAHVDKHELHETMQSAYKQCHSTETALVRVQNDILLNLDQKCGVILVLLDLSAAFDTIDHNVLLQLLQTRIGLSDSVLRWFRSYLTGRTQCVSIDNFCSKSSPLQYGVPQGSVLGPLLYTMYTLPLGDILREAGVAFHLYADDTQLYLSFDINNPSSQIQCKDKLQQCVSTIKSWMTQNKLKLNGDKTEIIFIASKFFQNSISLTDFRVDDVVILPSASVRNIGVIFDNTMSMKDQITAICKSAYFHLHNINRIRNAITYDCCEKLIHAFITSRLDCNNSTLYGLPEVQYKRLQRILNTSARILTKTQLSEHITPILKNLHWLPIEKRIHYKIILLTFKALHDLAPSYIKDLIKPYSNSRHLRSTNKHLLHIPKTRTKTFGDRSFSSAAPTLWNNLPHHLRTINNINVFKKNLKTFLFHASYS